MFVTVVRATLGPLTSVTYLAIVSPGFGTRDEREQTASHHTAQNENWLAEIDTCIEGNNTTCSTKATPLCIIFQKRFTAYTVQQTDRDTCSNSRTNPVAA
ncbi:hypothetical protein BDV96DRAFT_62429 [Lophiotrema nucula]|uniref:Uncharacterized protein n=1 Tax=Lophiotrema nucula TaxID=690887 RepID=A0A6A5Z978_9PLEO|nr:hypothetical protein BDV96DRAFT_62429 [Lophiotrema nucula]